MKKVMQEKVKVQQHSMQNSGLAENLKFTF